MAAVGQAGTQRVQVPQPDVTGSDTRSGASVTIEPSTNHEPRPGKSRLALRPYQPSPARKAASRSTSELSSATTTA